MFGIPTPEIRLAKTAKDAVKHAGEIGYPVVLKIHSVHPLHKSDINGVELNLTSPAEVKAAFSRIEQSAIANGLDPEGVTVQPMINLSKGVELLLGTKYDEQSETILVMKRGGVYADAFKEKACALAPVTPEIAAKMIQNMKELDALLGNYRNMGGTDQAEIARVAAALSWLGAMPWVREIDANPIVAFRKGAPGARRVGNVVALDARIVLEKEPRNPDDQRMFRTAVPLK